METRIQTIMFVDMAGYTKRSAKQTIDEMKLFHDELHGFVRTHVDKWSGILVKTLGDGFLIRFDSPTMAVQCGIEMQRKLASRNASMMNPENIVHFRIGINTGDVGIDEQGDLFGDPVNIASRIQTFAEANEVFISESTYLAMNQNEFKATDLGLQMFKNATREIRVYKILRAGEISSSASKPQQIPPLETGMGSFWKSPFFKGMTGVIAGALVILIVRSLAIKAGQKVPQPPKLQAPPSPAIAATKKPESVAPHPPGETTPKPVSPTPAPGPTLKPETASGTENHGPDADLDDDENLDLLLPENPGQGGRKNAMHQMQQQFLKQIQDLRAAKKFDEATKLAESKLDTPAARSKPQIKARLLMLLGKLSHDTHQPQKAERYLNEAAQNTTPNTPLGKKIEEFRAQLKKQPPSK